MKVYYAHCMAIYGSAQEARDMLLLKKLGFETVNPNDKKHKRGWARYGIHYFDRIMNQFDAVAFRANPEGSIPSGVYYEVSLAVSRGMPVFELPSGLSRRGMTLEQTREYLREVGER